MGLLATTAAIGRIQDETLLTISNRLKYFRNAITSQSKLARVFSDNNAVIPRQGGLQQTHFRMVKCPLHVLDESVDHHT